MAERGSGDRGGYGRGSRTGLGRQARRREDKGWVPVTKLGRLVKDGKITRIEQIYLHSLPVKEHHIIEQLLPGLRDEVMKIKPVQK